MHHHNRVRFVYSTTRNHQLAGLTLEHEAADEAHAAAYEAWDVLDERFHRLYHPNCLSSRLLDERYYHHLRRHWNCPSPLWPGLELKFKESVGKNKKRDDLLRRRNAAYDVCDDARERRLAVLKAWDDVCGFVRLLP